MHARPLIFDLLLQPHTAGRLNALQWDLLIRQARRANLLAKLSYVLQDAGLLDAVPAAPRRHLHAARQIAERQVQSIHWEARCLQRTLTELNTTVVLLKGAAYVMGGLPMARGRLFSDVDILVPRPMLTAVEQTCLMDGWRQTELSAYDRQYYRRWMHEIPPLQHSRRGSSLDIHHALLPDTARLKVNTAALFDVLQPLPDLPGLYTLAPADMFLHSATHLFHEGEFEHGARDLFDLRGLLEDFAAQPGFWDQLSQRATRLGLQRPLFYALRYTQHLLDVSVPAELIAQVAAWGPAPPLLKLMDACYYRALLPLHDSCDYAGAGCARSLLYLRSHWLRMPAHLLAYHLSRKVWVRMQPASDDAPKQAA